MSKKKPAKPSPSHLLSHLPSKLLHIRAELDDLIRAAEQQAEHDDSWKARCKIVQRENGYWDISSFDDKWWWAARLGGWMPTCRRSTRIGIYKTADKARRTLAACTVPPPGEEGR